MFFGLITMKSLVDFQNYKLVEINISKQNYDVKKQKILKNIAKKYPDFIFTKINLIRDIKTSIPTMQFLALTPLAKKN